MKGSEIVNKAKSLLGTPYVFGAKYQDGVLTLNRLKSLKKENPSTITENYYNKALKFVGKICTDCSGLVCYCYNMKDIGSYSIYDKLKKINLNKLKPGMAVWKPGHIGIYIGDGFVIEAKGINYGTIKSKLGDTPQVTGLYKEDIDYDNSTDYAHTGWCLDNKGRQYATGLNKGEYLKSGVYIIDGKYYAFDNEGYLITDSAKLKITPNGNIEVK